MVASVKGACSGPRDKCGVFGVYGHSHASRLAYFGLYALQHRGQESCGITVSDGEVTRHHKGMGLVPEVFDEDSLERLTGHLAVGHVRYSTTGATLLANAQPFLVYYGGEHYSIAHNGNLVNALELRTGLEAQGAIFQSTMDTETIVHLMARHMKGGFEHAVVSALRKVEGAYSLVIGSKKTLVGARDPHGFRPLCLGRLNSSFVLASETCALDLIDAKYVRDVEPGEIVFIDEKGLRSVKPFPETRPGFCIFEFIYFARPDSNIFGRNVYMVRKRLGQIMAREFGMECDLVMPIPDSGSYAAIGYAQAAGMPLEMGVIRNHYVGRTFIQPTQVMRDFAVKVKLNPVKEILAGNRIVVIEDSIIRGTTSKHRVSTLRSAGAKEVHMLVSCPPTRFPCYYGIDFSTTGELIASTKSVEEIREFIGLDSLDYTSLDGMVEATGIPRDRFCLACYTSEYPVPIPKGAGKFCLGSPVQTDGC